MNTFMRSLRRATLALTLSSFALTCAAAEAPPPAGAWHGELATPGGKLTLLIEFQQQDGKSISGQMESISQAPGQKIPLAEVKSDENKLSFTVPAIGANYSASWHLQKQEWVGEFRQGMTLPLTLRRGAPPAAATVNGLDGHWKAELKRDGKAMRLVLKVVSGSGGTRVTLDSPDLGAFGLPVEGFMRQGQKVMFSVPSTNVRFDGVLDGTAANISGTWSRPGFADAALSFQREAAHSAQRKRSQWPLAAASYRKLEVTIPNPAAPGVVLAGTLSVPQGKGPFPAAVLITGSGPQDRDETLFGHKPFAVLADFLTRRGIAVLRYDDRGFAKSTGSFAVATSVDFASDANAAAAFLRARPEVRADAVGFVGHSEGAMVAPIAASKDGKPAWIVMLAGPATRLDRVMESQRRAAGQARGASVDQLNKAETAIAGIVEILRTTASEEDGRRRLNELLTPAMLQQLSVSEAQRELVIQQFNSPWMRYFLSYQPEANLKRLSMPVLALAGALDQQVLPSENVPAMRAALAGKPDATVIELPGLNHLFQTAPTGAFGEYADIEETFAPKAMHLIADWILKRTI